MKKIGILFIFITIIVLLYWIIFPKNLGKHTPIWDVKERFFGDEYGELRSEYFISMRMQKKWYEQESIFFIWNDHDIFRMTEVYLRVKKEVADNCKVNTSGCIEWKRQDWHMIICANALTDDPISVQNGFNEYSLDETEDSINKFEEATGIKACEVLDPISVIRSEYQETLNKLSEIEYRKTCAKICKAIIRLIIMWGIYGLVCMIISIVKRILLY